MAQPAAADVVQALEESRTEFNNAVSGLTESVITRTPAAERWSILQCAEHVAAVEERFLGLLEGAQRTATPRIDTEREAEIAARVISRAQRIEAPEPVRPRGRFLTLAQAVEHFNAMRDRTAQFARERNADLYSLSIEHARFGVLNGVELLRLMAGHVARHADQIRETRSSLATDTGLPS